MQQYFPYIAKKLTLHDRILSLTIDEQIKFWIKALETSYLKDDQDTLNQLIEAGYFVQVRDHLRENEYKPYYSTENEWVKYGEDMTPYLLKTIQFHQDSYDAEAIHTNITPPTYNELIRTCIMFLQTNVRTMDDEQNIQSLKELVHTFAKRESELQSTSLGYGAARFCLRVLHNWSPELYPAEEEFKTQIEILNYPAYQTTY
jgi:hypothetical protein